MSADLQVPVVLILMDPLENTRVLFRCNKYEYESSVTDWS